MTKCTAFHEGYKAINEANIPSLVKINQCQAKRTKCILTFNTGDIAKSYMELFFVETNVHLSLYAFLKSPEITHEKMGKDMDEAL